MPKNLFIDASHPNQTRVVLKSENDIEDYEYEGKNNNLIWKKVKMPEKDHNSGIKWEKYNDQNDFLFTEKDINNSVNSFNRSIVINDKDVGPDIAFLVPIGFKSSEEMRLDFSIRGWNRRPKNSDLFAWNNGDAVGQAFLNIFNNEKQFKRFLYCSYKFNTK